MIEGVIGSSVAHRQREVEAKVFSEVGITGFSHIDHEIAFYTQVAALLRPDSVVLDFGAGRGEWLDDPVPYRRKLRDFRGRCAAIHGCDTDPAVLRNRSVQHPVVTNGPLPYADSSFDLIVSRHVFEHLADPDATAAELIRVLRPGGWLCAMTPNKWGYPAIGARLIRDHCRALALLQPGKQNRDTFPTYYRLNTLADARRVFPGCAVHHYRSSAVPAYHCGSVAAFKALRLLHRLTPPPFHIGLHLFISKLMP
jgi:SAM-dependent methyltransferase